MVDWDALSGIDEELGEAEETGMAPGHLGAVLDAGMWDSFRYIPQIPSVYSTARSVYDGYSHRQKRKKTPKFRKSGKPECCPECGDIVVSRLNKKLDIEFWGCNAFPVCKWSWSK